MAKSEDIEIDEDETSKKARDIGKKMGAVKDKNPEDEDDDEDYEIEVSDDEEDDRKLGKNADRDASDKDKSAEEKRAAREKLSNREKRHLRKQKNYEKHQQKDAIIEAQARKIADIERRQAETENRFHGITKAEVERAFAESQNRFRQAEQEAVAAVTENDGARSVRAMQVMKEEDDRMKSLRGTYEQINRAPAKQENAQESRPQHDPRVVNQAKKWANKNDWYDPNGSDEDSAIAKAVAGVLVNEGWDPTSKDYWDELDSRLEERLDKKQKNEDEQDEDDDYEEEDALPQKKRRTGPPSTGSSKRSDSISGKRTIRVPTAYVEKMKREVPEIWNDPKRRKKLLDERARIIREQSER